MAKSPGIAVVGTGAIGGVVAAALGDYGHQVTLCARTPFARLARVYEGETTHYEHPVCTEPAAVGPCEWLLLCTKAYQIDGARPWLDALIGPNTRLVVMQNGVDHVDRVAGLLPPDRVVPAILLLPGEALEPGLVKQTRAGVIRVPDDANGRAFAALFPENGPVTAETSDDFLTEVWKKLIPNSAGGAICTLTLTPIRELTDERVRDLATALMREIIAVGRAEGAQIDESFIETCIASRRGRVGEHWTSISVDWREGRPMEWDARNAVVGRIGRKHGIPTPYNDAVTALLSLADEKGGRFRR